jgi:hypothetical protein
MNLDAIGRTFCAMGITFLTAGMSFFLMKFFGSGALARDENDSSMKE